MEEGSRSLNIEVQLTESETMNVGEGSSLLSTKIQAIEIREGSRLGVATGMDELINIAQYVKNEISH